MRTFSEHQHRVRTFVEVINEDDTKNLIKDLEDINVHQDSFSISDIEDAWGEIISEPAFAEETYVTITTDEEFDVDISNHNGHSDITVTFTGSIDIDEVDSASIVSDIMSTLDGTDDNYDQQRWSAQEIEEALDRVAWSDYVVCDSSDAEPEITNMNSDAGEGTIEYGLKDDSYFVTADVKDMWSDFENELGIK